MKKTFFSIHAGIYINAHTDKHHTITHNSMINYFYLIALGLNHRHPNLGSQREVTIGSRRFRSLPDLYEETSFACCGRTPRV